MMSTLPPESEHAQPPDQGEQDLVRYVEDLAGPGDYWVSITDAARITRTSEAMARRWVSSGRLPIRKQAVGLNQRTRLVRASDLEQIRPIVDPSAAIIDAVRKVDIPSIPRVQERLLAEQQHLIAQMHDMQEAVRDVRTRLEQVAAKQLQEAEAFSEQLLASQDELHRAVEQAQQHHEALTAQLANQARQAEQRTTELAEQIQASHRRIEERLEQVAAGAEALQAMMPDYEARHEAQDRVIETWTGQLQEEIEAGQARDERLVTLEGQYQELRRTVESLAKRGTRSSAAQ
jgi:hypothetical protein